MLTLAMCGFPITFDELWQMAAFCGGTLIAILGLIIWQRHSLKKFVYMFLMPATLIGIIWSFMLAVVTSRNYLICAGIPFASADLVRRAEENYHTLLIFQSVVAATDAVTLILVLIFVFSLYFAYRK